jgi:hypothetical protein
VLPPDGRIKPVIQPALIDGDQVIRVQNQIPGGTLMIRVWPDASQPFEEFGSRDRGANALHRFVRVGSGDRTTETAGDTAAGNHSTAL